MSGNKLRFVVRISVARLSTNQARGVLLMSFARCDEHEHGSMREHEMVGA